MPLQLWKRHTKSCREKNAVAEYDQSLKRCKCPIHAWGTLRDEGFVGLGFSFFSLDLGGGDLG